jgi:hypothetical protein
MKYKLFFLKYDNMCELINANSPDVEKLTAV